MAKKISFSAFEIQNVAVVVALFCASFVNSQFVLTDKPEGTQTCESNCMTVYNDKSSDVVACRKGCRLVSIIDFMIDDSTLDELQSECQKSCLEAYGSEVAAAPCAFGCQGQLPAIDSRHKRLRSFYDEDASFSSPFIPIYFERMMGCMLDQIRHEMTVGFMFLSMVDQQGRGQVVIIQQRPVIELVGRDDKTSNYLETNLETADNVATPDIKRSQMPAAAAASVSEMDFSASGSRPSDASDWLTCVAAKIGLSRMSLLFILMMFVISFVWLFISSMTTSAKVNNIPAQQKLNIYGDADFLSPIDEKMRFAYMKPLDPSIMAAGPLPVKILIQEI